MKSEIESSEKTNKVVVEQSQRKQWLKKLDKEKLTHQSVFKTKNNALEKDIIFLRNIWVYKTNVFQPPIILDYGSMLRTCLDGHNNIPFSMSDSLWDLFIFQRWI